MQARDVVELAPVCLDDLEEVGAFLADVAARTEYQAGLDTYDRLPAGVDVPELLVRAYAGSSSSPFLALCATGRFVEMRLYDERFRPHYGLLYDWLRERAAQRLSDPDCRAFLQHNKERLVHLVRRDTLVAWYRLRSAPVTPGRPWWARLLRRSV
ncbi:MAG TPA: hypothetical protein VK464_10955 [Symbiobacteriaceae bacterium]|nr:hypothetical protein [Symbiobacteriaceae bacterium]